MPDEKYSIQIEIDPKTQGARVVKNDLKGVAKEAKKTTTAIDFMKKSIAGLAATVTLGAVFKLSKAIVLMGATFEKTMKTVGGVSRATAKELQQLTDVAREMGATTEFTANQAGQALQFLAMAGFTAEQSIAALPGTLDLATAGQLDLASASDIVTDTLTAMGLKVGDLTRLNDVFIATITRSNTNVQMLGQSFKFAAPIAAQLGISIESLSAMFGILANSGIKASDAGTDLRQALLRTAKAAETLGLDKGSTLIDVLEELNRKQADVNEVTDLFGIIATKSVLVLKENIEQYRKLHTELDNADGESKELADTMRDTLSGSFATLNSAVSETGLVLFDLTKESIKDTTDAFIVLTNSVNSALRELLKFSTSKIVRDIQIEDLKSVNEEIIKIEKEIAAIRKAREGAGEDIFGATKGLQRIQSLNKELVILKQNIAAGLTGAKEFSDKLLESRLVGGAPTTTPTPTTTKTTKTTNADFGLVDLPVYLASQKRVTAILAEAEQERNNIARDTLNKRAMEQQLHIEEMAALRKQRADDLKKEQEESITGIQKGLNTLSTSYGDLGKQMESFTISAFGNMEDALLEFTKTGELNFKTLTDAIMEDLKRILIRALIMKPIIDAITGFAFGGASATTTTPTVSPTITNAQGNVFSGGGVHAFAKGGIVDSPTIFPFQNGIGLMGEAGAEAILPLTRTSTGELGVKTNGGGNNGVVVNVQVVKGDSEETTVDQTVDSTGFINNILIAVGGDIANGGMTARTIEGRYGLSNVPQRRAF
jgi:TP901 family phage tail tape measure protein